MEPGSGRFYRGTGTQADVDQVFLAFSAGHELALAGRRLLREPLSPLKLNRSPRHLINGTAGT